MVLMSTHKRTIFWYIDGHCNTVQHIVNTCIIKRNYSLCPKHTSESPRWDGFGVYLEHIRRGYLYILTTTRSKHMYYKRYYGICPKHTSKSPQWDGFGVYLEHMSIDIPHTKYFIAPHVLTEIITYWGDSGECRKRDKLTNQKHGCRLPVCRTDPGQREITPID